MASILGLVNRLLPFATPGTPLLQDLIHLGAICTLLYYAPQIQHWAQERQHATGESDGLPIDDTANLADANPAPHDQEPARDDDEMNQRAAVDDFENVEFGDQGGPHDDANIQEGEPGPAGPANTPAHRNLGAKKAKSLARKDQRRAYNEFMRSQGDAQRAEDAKDAAEREATLAAERERRKAATATLEAEGRRDQVSRISNHACQRGS
jgi:hypothetical protein